MDVVDLTRLANVALYVSISVLAGYRAFRFVDPGAKSLAGFISFSALLWALFYVAIGVGWISGTSAILFSRVVHLPVIGIFFATLNSENQRNQLVRKVRDG